MLVAGNYDLVKTYRAQRQDGLYRQILSKTYNVLFRLIFSPNYPLHDINSKPKVMTRAAYECFHLASNDWFTDAEIMIEALRNKLHIGELSTVFYKNERRKTLVNYSTILEFTVNLFYYRFFKKR